MGAKQSKRSVDITTDKEVIVGEGGEVAVAGGEGKLEKIEDLDTLKPQLNGDAGHQEVEISEKEKKMQQQDEAPENEKDTSNEKDIILSPVTNGTHDDGETPKENAENTESETNKKNKKEKVKKKWSFRSFSFNKKDKQKPPKKEETNGECEKVPEETGENPVPVSNEIESKMETEATEKEISKTDEKTPDTPVTEPMTNGSSAPESPKEEIRQNGETALIEEQPAVAVVPDPVKPVEVAEVPSVESLPINGLKIEESCEEPKAVTDSITEETSVPEAEAKKEVVETEVCVVKEKVEAVESAETAPPLPVNPPPSSLTIFAESTMAPHLVENSVVGDMPVVDVDASISSVPQPITENVTTTDVIQEQAISEPNISVCQNNPIDNVLSASPNEIEQKQSSPVSCEKGNDSPIKVDENAPLESASTIDKTIEVVDSCVASKIVENPAVVSATEIDPPIPESENIVTTPSDDKGISNVISADSKVEPEPVLIPPVTDSTTNVIDVSVSSKKEIEDIEHPVELKNIPSVESNIPSGESNIAVETGSVIANVPELEITNTQTQSSSTEIPISSTENKCELDLNTSSSSIKEVQELSVKPLEVVSNVTVEINNLSSVNASESPLLQRTPSDPDVSETALVELTSDSFPPPPPPASCPESITELSVSESLPPPPSEYSQPETILNSPTSEISDLPVKDLPSPVKTEFVEQKDSLESEVLPNVEAQAVETTLIENGTTPSGDLSTETTPNQVPETSLEQKKIEESQPLPSAETSSQVKTISEVIDIPPVEPTPIVTESITTEVVAVSNE